MAGIGELFVNKINATYDKPPKYVYTTKDALLDAEIICTERTVLHSLSIQNIAKADVYIQIYDIDTVPGNGAIPATLKLPPFLVASNQILDYSLPFPISFDNGLVIMGSSTQLTVTKVGAPCLVIVAQLDN